VVFAFGRAGHGGPLRHGVNIGAVARFAIRNTLLPALPGAVTPSRRWLADLPGVPGRTATVLNLAAAYAARHVAAAMPARETPGLW